VERATPGWAPRLRAGFVATLALGAAARTALAAGDEIQVYLDDLSAPGEIGLDLHLNFVLSGRTTPDWPGELPPHHVLQGTPEFGFGVTRWLELGLYLPTAVSSGGDVYGNGVKVRVKVVPRRGGRSGFFWGANVEVGRVARRVSEQSWTVELRPILGVRGGRLLLAANPILGFPVGGGSSAQGELEPAVKLGFEARPGLAVGVEHYSALGTVGKLAPRGGQAHETYAVLDYEGHGLSLNLGVGRGFTEVSDHWVAKAIVGFRLR
jgi:hypothetical protein